MAINTDHFRSLLTSESANFNQLCELWSTELNGENANDIPEEAIGQIRTTIGQANLLMNQRFKQFTGLIDDCQFKRGDKETKVEDLQGFWDMIYFQVEDVQGKFRALEELKKDNWKEKECEKIVMVKKEKQRKIDGKTKGKPLAVKGN